MKMNIKSLTIASVIAVVLGGIAYAGQTTIPLRTLQAAQTATNAGAVKPVARVSTEHTSYITVNPLDVVKYPSQYLNKNIKIKAKFDKFSTLGLDYKPAMMSSEKYISFLIQRPDVLDHNIPLSEMKIFLTRTEAEKYIELNSGDIIEFTGQVFSNALGDPWIKVDSFTVITSTPKKEVE